MSELSNNPSVVNAAIAEATKEAPVQVTTVPPSNNEVILPGGYISPAGALSKYAEVRELNGADEEAIAKSGSIGKALNTILQKGLTSVGGEPITKDTLDDMLSADRDAVLLAIRKVTFGSEVEYRAVCGSCGEDSIVSIDLDIDVPVTELRNPVDDRTWVVEGKAGPIALSLPTGIAQRKLMENSDKTTAELNTILLAECVISVNGQGSVGASTVLKLGMGDRDMLINEILEKNPGPRLGEVMKTCEACGEQVNTPLSLVSLFRL